MDKPVVLIGVGEMGGVFARGLLRSGRTVIPATRSTHISALAEKSLEPEMVLIAVGEDSLQTVLAQVPKTWLDNLCLLQNELLPKDWVGIPQPTVVSVWFEKKPGFDPKVILPSPVYGPKSDLIEQALDSIHLPVKRLNHLDELIYELVLKNLYILVSNIAGLNLGGIVDSLWRDHLDFTKRLAMEVMDIQELLVGSQLDRDGLMAGLKSAIDGNPDHQCMGRSAVARLNRALMYADQFTLPVPVMRRIQSELAH